MAGHKKIHIMILGICIVALILAEISTAIGLLSVWTGFIITVLVLPVFLVALMLWWRAPGGEKDLPFTGY